MIATTTRYILSQCVSVAIESKEWIDIKSDTRPESCVRWAKQLKRQDPSIVLGMRSVTETEIHINYND